MSILVPQENGYMWISVIIGEIFWTLYFRIICGSYKYFINIPPLVMFVNNSNDNNNSSKNDNDNDIGSNCKSNDNRNNFYILTGLLKNI